jgi:hypothetical protein
MGMRDKKRNQKRVLARRTAAPRPGEGKDFLVRGSHTPFLGFREIGKIGPFFVLILGGVVASCAWCSRWKEAPVRSI